MLVGIISGVISAMIVYVIGFAISNTIIPYYYKRTYKGVNLTGSWVLMSDDYNRREIKIEIKQEAEYITAISTHTLVNPSSSNSTDNVRVYVMTGSINDRFITLVGKPNDKSKLGALLFLFEVIGDGNTLKGVGVAYSSTEHRIGSRMFIAKRK